MKTLTKALDQLRRWRLSGIPRWLCLEWIVADLIHGSLR